MASANAAWSPREPAPPETGDEQGELLSRLFHGTAEGMAVVRIGEGTILDANDAFLRLIDLPREEVIGSSSFELGLWAELGDEATARAALYERAWLEDLMATVVSATGKVSTMKLSAELIPDSDERQPVILVRATDSAGFAHSTERFRAMREAEARYRSLVEQLPAIVYTQIADASSPTGYRDVYISPQTEQKLGYAPEEWRSDPELWMKVTHPDDLPAVLEEENETGDTGRPFTSTYRMIARDGQVLWFRDDAVLVEDPATGLRLWKGVMLEITQQKEAQEHLREAEARYRALIERIPAIVYHSEFTVEGEWLYMSPQVEDIFGYTPQEWMDHPHPMASFCHPDDSEAMREAEERSYRTGVPFHAEYRMKSDRIDDWKWIVDEAAVVRDEHDRPLHMLGVMFDMTDRKKAEEALREALQRERESAVRLRVLDIQKSTLLHTLSHDLKSPITAINTAAMTLEQLRDELSAADTADLVHTIAVRARKMGELLSDLLDLDRLDRGIIEPTREPVDLGELLRTTVTGSDHAGGRPIELDLPGGVVLPVDPTKLERIVENLLSNAALHTPRGTPIRVALESDPNGATISVEDRGPGVPDELKRAVFDEFRRGPDAGVKGSGIGLSLVVRFAELHAGRAWVEDRPGGGASFRVFLPAS